MVLPQDQAQRYESERIIEYQRAKAQYEKDLALYEQQQAELERIKAEEVAAAKNIEEQKAKAEAEAKAKAEAEAKAKAEAEAKARDTYYEKKRTDLLSYWASGIKYGKGRDPEATYRNMVTESYKYVENLKKQERDLQTALAEAKTNTEYRSAVWGYRETYTGSQLYVSLGGSAGAEKALAEAQDMIRRGATRKLAQKYNEASYYFVEGYNPEAWQQIVQADERNRANALRQSAGLRASGNAQIQQSQVAELQRLGGTGSLESGAGLGTTIASQTLTIGTNVADRVPVAQGTAELAQAWEKGFTTETAMFGYQTTGEAEKLRQMQIADYTRTQTNIAVLKDLGINIDVEALNKSGVMSAYNMVELQKPTPIPKPTPSQRISSNIGTGTTTDPFKAQQPNQSMVSPLLSSSISQTIIKQTKTTVDQQTYTQELRAGNVGLATALLRPQTPQSYFVSGLGQVSKSQTSINLEKFLQERGYDITKPETIPDSIFKPTKYVEARKQARRTNVVMGDLTQLTSSPTITLEESQKREAAKERYEIKQISITDNTTIVPQITQTSEGYFYPPKPMFTVTTPDGKERSFKTYESAQKFAARYDQPVQTVAGSLSYIFRPEPKTTPTQEALISVSKFLDEAAKFKTGNVVLDQIIDPLKFPIGVTRSVVEGLSTLDNLGKQTVAPFVDQALGRKPTQYTVTPVRQTGDAIIFPYSFEDNRFKSWGEISAQAQQYIREYGGGTFAGEVVSLVVPTGKSIYDVSRRIGTGIAPKLIPKITPTLAAAAISEARITPKVAAAVKTEVAAKPQGLVRFSRANEIDLPKGFEPAAVSVTPKPSDYGTLGQKLVKAPITDTVIAPNYGVVSKATVTAINESQKSPVFYRLLKLTSESKAPERPNLNILQELKAAQKLQRDTDIANQIKIANQKPQPQPKNISRANEIYAELDRDVINTVGLKSQEIPDAARGVSRGGLDLKKISQEILDEMRYKKFKIEQPIVTDVQPTGNFPLRDFVPRTPIPFRDTNVVRETIGRLGITKSKAPITKTRYIVDTAPQIPKTGVAPQIKGIPVKEVGKAPFDPLFVKFKGRVEPIPEGVSIGKPVKDFPLPQPTLDVLTSSGTPVGYAFKGVTRYDKGVTSFAQFQKALEPKTISSATTPKSPRVDPTYGKIMTGGQSPRYSPMSFTKTAVNVKSPIVNPTYERLTASSGQPYTASAFRTAEKSTSISLGRGLGEIVSKDDPRFIDKGLKAFKDFQSLIRQPPDFVPSAPRKGVFRPDTTIKLGRGLGEIVSKDDPRFIDKGLKGFKEFQERIENPKFNLPTSSKSPLSFTRPTSAPKPRDFNKPRDFKKPRDFTKSDEGGLKEVEGKGGTLLQVVKEESPFKSTQISLGKGKGEVIIKKKSALSDPEPSKDPLISTGGLSGTSPPATTETVSSITVIPPLTKRETVKPREFTLQQPQTKVEVKAENILQTKSEIISKTQTIVSPKLTTIVSPKLTTKISPKLSTKISPKLVTEVTPKLGTKQTPKLGTRQQLKTPTPQRPKLRSRPMFKFQAKAQTKLDNPPIVPTRRRVVGGLPSPDKGKKKKGKKKSDTGIEFLGSSKLDSIVGLFRREAVIFGDKQVSKQVKRDTKVKVKI